MYQEEIVLCGASSYTKKYYFNEMFSSLPQGIQDELHIMCVLFTADVGGALQLVFDEEGHLQMRTQTEEDDILYDEIGSVLKIKQLQRDKEELFESLEMFYRVFCLGEEYQEVEKSIFKAANNVYLDSVLGWEQDGVRHSFLEKFED